MSDKLVKKDTSVGGWVIANKAVLEAVVPKQVSADRLLRVAVRAVESNPKLLECSKTSLIAALSQCFVLGLEPGATLGQSFLIPFWNGRTKQSEVQVFIGYKGLIDLCMRSGKLEGVWTRVVYANDHFRLLYGHENRIEHVPVLEGDPGEIIGAYAYYKTVTGFMDFEYMTIVEIEKIRGRSKAKDSGPWVTDYTEMVRKCPLRRLLKRAPQSVEQATAVRIDDLNAAGEAPDYKDAMDAIDVPMIEVDEEEERDRSRQAARLHSTATPASETDTEPPSPESGSDALKTSQDAKRKRLNGKFHAMGNKLWPDSWTEERASLIAKEYPGKSSTNDLDNDELTFMIEVLEREEAERTEAQGE